MDINGFYYLARTKFPNGHNNYGDKIKLAGKSWHIMDVTTLVVGL